MRTILFAIVSLYFWGHLTPRTSSAAEYFEDDFEGSTLNSFWSLLAPSDSQEGLVSLMTEQPFRGAQSLKISRDQHTSELIFYPDPRAITGIYHVFEDPKPCKVQVFLSESSAPGTPVLMLYERPPWTSDPGRWIAVFPDENLIGRFYFVNSEGALYSWEKYTWETPWDPWNEIEVAVHSDFREVKINGVTSYLDNFGFNVAGVALCVLTRSFDDFYGSGGWYFDWFSCEDLLFEGIHVSHQQNEASPTKTINWAEVAGAGKTFAYVKASQWDRWPDGDGPEHDFTANNVRDAQQAGLHVGVYHVAGNTTAKPPVLGDAVAEAEYFCSRASSYIGHRQYAQYRYLPPVLRLETDFGLTQRQLSDWTRKWLQTVECQTGIRPFIYTVPDVLPQLDPELWGSNRRSSGTQTNWLWIGGDPSALVTDPACVSNTCIPKWMFNQYADSGTCPGITGPVPLDRFNGRHGDLWNFTYETGEEVEAPSAWGYSFKAVANQTTRIPMVKVLAHAYDPRNLPVELHTILSISDKSGDVSIEGEDIVYTPPLGFVGADRFALSLQNCRGVTSVAQLFVTVVAQESGSVGNGSNLSSITAGADGIRLTFYGIPNQAYSVQRSGNLTTWTTLATLYASGTGKIMYTDNHPLSAAYYRTATTGP
jgi:GH25 family lysozyme M1 (1,4-beta-N-acetylmuramidase)